MYFCMILSVFLLVLQNSVAPPVTKEKAEENEPNNQDVELNLEYQRYVKEVLHYLESDEEFRKTLEKVNDTYIQSGQIADHLQFVSHNVRSKLDEAKRKEIERLKTIVREKLNHDQNVDKDHLRTYEHIDHDDYSKFGTDDFKKLINKVTKDLNEADEKRRQEFKEYEMQKKFEQEEKMKNMTEEEKKTFEKQLEENEIKQKDHEPLHHPGSKKQMEEVWEKKDHMEDQEFNPLVFFHMHDVDSDGFWDEDELKTVLLGELDKMYPKGHPENLVERHEELERMREHVFNEADKDGDRLISLTEFSAYVKREEYQKDPGWETLDQQQIYSNEEYEAYRQQHAMEMAQQYHGQMGGYNQFPAYGNEIPQGHHPGGYPPQHQPMQPPHQGQYAGQDYQHQIPQPQYGHQVPQHQQYQVPQPNHGLPPGQYPPQHQPMQPPQQGQYAGQGYQQQLPPQQQQQYHPNDINYVPQQNHQQQAQGNQVPQQQFHQPQDTNAIPQQPPVAAQNLPPQQFQQNSVPSANVPQSPSQQVPVSNAIPQQQTQQQFQQQPQQQFQQQAQQPQQQFQQAQQQPQQAGINQQPNQQQFQQPAVVAQTANVNQQQQPQQQNSASNVGNQQKA